MPLPEPGALITFAVHGPEWVRLKSFSVGPAAFAGTRSLDLGAQDRLTYLLDAKTAGQLAIESKGDASCSLNVTLSDDKGTLSERQLPASAQMIPLVAARTGSLRLDVEEQRCAHDVLSRLVLSFPAAATVKKISAEPPKHVVFWVMDSLRADHVRAINPKTRPASPLCAFTESGGGAWGGK